MKRVQHLPVCILTGFIMLTTAGCKKWIEYKGHFSFCNVTAMKYNKVGQLTITYNEFGNPVTMLEANPKVILWGNYYLRYDKLNRVKDFLTTYDGPGVLTWNTYTYKPAKREIVDTQYNYAGLITDAFPPYNAENYRVFIYSLDAAGRIIKNTEVNHDGQPPFIINYKYDARGNLIREGYTYDDKVNPYQTNKIWQLLFKDYSNNNPIGAEGNSTKINTYNESGLPLTFTCNSDMGCESYFGRSVEDLELVYDCEVVKQLGK